MSFALMNDLSEELGIDLSPASASRGSAKVRQICEADIPQVIGLLARGFPERSRHFWTRVMSCLTERPALPGLPRYGYLLESDRIVGVILEIFSKLHADGSESVRCNVSSWYVEPGFRNYGALLAAKALSHPDVTYLNVTPAQNTLAMLKIQGYSQYSKGIFVSAPLVQLRSAEADVRDAVADRIVHADRFDRDLLMDHSRYGCISLWCETAARAYPFVFRPCMVKRIIPSAKLVYCHDVDDFVRFAGPIGRFLAFRGRALVLIDSNGPIAGLIGRYLDAKTPKFFRGAIRPRLGDLAYTETAMFGI
jgi:hypothetical protein